jgi:hypothetical protein
LKSREATAAMRNMEFRAAEMDAVAHLVPEAQKIAKVLKSRKTEAPKDAYFYIASWPPEMLVFIEVELANPRVASKLRNYIQKWRPLRLALPAGELDALGIARGPKFDKILEQLFEMQLRGKGRDPESRTKILRQLAGIKEEPKKKPEKEKKVRKGKATIQEAKTQEKGKPQGAATTQSDTSEKASPQKGAGAGPMPSHAAAAIGARAKEKHAEATEHRRETRRARDSHARPARGKPKVRGTKKSHRR